MNAPMPHPERVEPFNSEAHFDSERERRFEGVFLNEGFFPVDINQHHRFTHEVGVVFLGDPSALHPNHAS